MPLAAPTPHVSGHLPDVMRAAVSELRTTLPFEAMQLLRHDPRRGTVSEALRLGYSPDSAWALQHLFVQKYRVGFTRALSPNDGLPPAISSVRPEYREDFVTSTIYRDHLHRAGYRDGISMELFLRGAYVGIAHFSSTRDAGFTAECRRAASSVRGLLAALLLETPAGRAGPAGAHALGTVGDPAADHVAEPRWRVWSALGSDSGDEGDPPAPLRDDAFRAHVEQFRASGLPTARHLWLEGAKLHRVELRALPHSGEVAVGVSPASPDEHFRLTVQELRVLSLLCTGRDDATIARHLHLSRRTVESHVVNARRKLGARNRVEAVVRALATASVLADPVRCPLDAVWGGAASPRRGDPA